MPGERTSYEALRVSVTFSGLIKERDQTFNLFAEEEQKQETLAKVMDSLKSKGCKVDMGSVFWMQQAPKRIPFEPPQ